MPARAVLFAAAAVVGLAAAVTLGAGTLEPYRALARSPQGPHIAAFARAEIQRALDPPPPVASDADSAAPAPPPLAFDAADSTAPDWPGPPCGVYLTLMRGGTTRACVGSLTPLGPTLAGTLRELARQVIASDPRHPPLRRDELALLRIVVAFAGPPAAVADPMQVAPAREGLLIAAPGGSIAFLPGEARTVAWALREARRLGVLARDSDASYQKFSVVTVHEAP